MGKGKKYNAIHSEGAACTFETSSASLPGEKSNLTATSESADLAAIYISNAKMTFSGCTVTAVGPKYGIRGDGGDKSAIAIESATVSATGGEGGGSITGFTNIIGLSGCVFTKPDPDEITPNPAMKAYCTHTGNIITEEIRTEPVVAYPLSICGRPVTSLNVDKIKSFPGVGGDGSVTFDPEQNVLTLNGITMEPESGNCIKSAAANLKIVVQGENTLTSTGISHAVLLEKGVFSIEGEGTLKVNSSSTEAYAIYAKDANLSIKDAKVVAVGKRGISGGLSLSLDKAVVSARGDAEGSIMGFNAITFSGCHIDKPSKTEFNSSKKAICFSADQSVVKVEVSVIVSTPYDLWFGGEQITDGNMDMIGTAIAGVSGKVSYNPNTKTLRLEEAEVNIQNEHDAIRSTIEGLQIEVVGVNTIKVNNAKSCLNLEGKGSKILGAGTLNLEKKGTDGYALNANGADVTINGAKVLASNNVGSAFYIKEATMAINRARVIAQGSSKYGIEGFSTSTTAKAQLVLDGCELHATGNQGSIYNLDNMELSNCSVATPSEGNFNADQKALCTKDGALVKGTAAIVPTQYNFEIAGMPVDYINKDDLTVLNGEFGCTVEGKAAYDPDTKTLTLEDAKIHAVGLTCGIFTRKNGEGLIVEVKGTNTLQSEGLPALRLESSATIKGEGVLNLTNTNKDQTLAEASGVYAESSSLTIEGCTLSATGEYAGIFGGSVGSDPLGTLTIKNATVEAAGKVVGSIHSFADIILSGVDATSPEGVKSGKGSESFYSMRYSNGTGDVVKELLRIEQVYTVRFETNGGSAITDVTVVKGGKVSRPDPAPTKANHTFIDWYSDATLQNVYNFEAVVEADLTLHAKWESNVHTVTFTVTETDGTTPIQDAVVSVGTTHQKTDASGKTSFELAKGPYTYSVNRSGYDPVSDVLFTVAGGAQDIPVKLTQSAVPTFTLVYTAGEGGEIVGDATQTIEKGKDGAQVEAKANPSYEFVEWSDGKKDNPRIDKNVTKDLSVSAKFKRVLFTVTFVVTLDGTAIPIEGAKVSVGTVTRLTGTDGKVSFELANDDYSYRITADGFNSVEDGSFTVDNAAQTIPVKLSKSAATTFTLKYRAGEGGEIIGECDQTVGRGDDGAEVEAKAKPGYKFVKWSDDVMTAKRIDKNVRKDIDVTVEFEQVSFTVTFTVTDGINPIEEANVSVSTTVQQTVSTTTRQTGSDGKVSFELANGDYTFRVTKSGFKAKEGGKFTVNSLPENFNVELTKSADPTFTLVYRAGEGGYIVGNSNQTVKQGEDGAEVEAKAKAGYKFVKWSDEKTDNPRVDKEVAGNIDVEAKFEPAQQFSITFEAPENGLLSVVTQGGVELKTGAKVDEGSEITIMATPSKGYKLKSLKVNDKDFENGATHKVDGNVVIVAEFEVDAEPVKQYTVTYYAPKNGKLEVKDAAGHPVASGKKVEAGSVLTITATPDPGFKLRTLTVNNVKFESGKAYKVLSNVEIVAEFDAVTPVEAEMLHLTLFPNPAQSQITLEGLESASQVTIFNQLGGVVLSAFVQPNQSIDVSALPAGVYVLRVEGVVLRFVKE